MKPAVREREDVISRMTQIMTELEELGTNVSGPQELRFDALTDEYRNLDERRQVLERSIALDGIRSATIGGGDLELMDGAPNEHRRRGDSQRDQASRTIDAAVRSGMLADHAAEKAQNLVDHGTVGARSLAARWAVATGSDHYLTAFAKVLSDPTRGHMLWDGQEQEAYRRVTEVQSEMRAMSLTDANGGYMVPLTLDPAILLTSAGSINPLRQVARVEQTVTDTWTGITSAGATAEWKAEAAQAADGSPTVDDQPIPVHFGDAFVPYSFEVGMDAVRFTEELQMVLVDAADQLMATAYTTGSGTGQPKGFITALAGTSSEINAAADDTFARGDVYNLQNQLPARFQANASWLASLPIINLLSQFELSTGGSRPFASVDEGRLLNRPIRECSNMDPTVTTSGATSNFILAYGDWRQAFCIVDRIGTTLELIPNLFGANGRPTGQRGAFLWFRTGSDALVTNAARMLDVASAA